MSLAVSANGLYDLSKSSTVNSTVATSASVLPHRHRRRHRHWHWHWHRQWQCLADFVFKICLSSSAAIKLIALCTARLLATLNEPPSIIPLTCLSKTPTHNPLHSSAPSVSHNSAPLFGIVIQIDPLNFLVLRTVCHAAELSIFPR
jgi:hypothetical protein